ncbi:hypothetical protein [Legionella cardiaca]|uniref:Uncharacterized protein n=1 Tax=Legionella cardiaca TaxID=1071983 RepID=A0ABY8AMD3_9GAMM|nr:hypothetical protein [Legionella cardiaca]WED41810.1 hypothetical protein PXX05_07645 [Legionella cardiaca]
MNNASKVLLMCEELQDIKEKIKCILRKLEQKEIESSEILEEYDKNLLAYKQIVNELAKEPFNIKEIPPIEIILEDAHRVFNTSDNASALAVRRLFRQNTQKLTQIKRGYGHFGNFGDGRASSYRRLYEISIEGLIPPYTPLGLLLVMGTAIVHAIDAFITHVRIKYYQRQALPLIDQPQTEQNLLLGFALSTGKAFHNLSLFSQPKNLPEQIKEEDLKIMNFI